MTTPTPDQIHHWLTELPDLAALLPDAMVTRPQHLEGTRPTPGPSEPINLTYIDILDTRDRTNWLAGMEHCDPDGVGILPYLWGWVRDIEADMLDQSPQLPDETPETPTLTNCCTWLANHLHWAQNRPQWPEMAAGIQQTHQRVRAAVAHVHEHQRPVRCDRCKLPLERVQGTRPLWECPSGHLTSVQAVTLKEAARIIGIRNARLQAYANRNLIQRITDGNRILYDLASIRAIVAEERLRAG